MHGLIPLAFFAAALLATMAVTVGLLRWRRYRLRKIRKSPLTSDLLRPPAQHLREQLEELRDDVDLYVTMLIFLPTLIFAVHVSQSYFGGAAETPWRIGINAIATLGGLGYCLLKLLRLQKRQDQLRVGYDAELAVGQELDQLMRQGAAVFHDFPADKFNIDHIVISPVGVFAVETKGRSKPVMEKGKSARVEYDGKALKFQNWTETAAIAQAERQAKWLKDWLTSAVGEHVSVRPVLAIPGWFVDAVGRGTARDTVDVYSGRQLEWLLKNSSFDTIAEDKMQRIVHQVESRCRNIKPMFNGLPKA